MGSRIHPTELTVSHNPRKCGLQGILNVVLKPAATSNLLASFRLYSRRAYGMSPSFPGVSNPHICKSPQRARAVKADYDISRHVRSTSKTGDRIARDKARTGWCSTFSPLS